MHFAGYYTKVDLATDALAERSKAVAQGAIPKGRGFEPHRRHFCLLHQRNLTSRMGDRWGITERSHCLRGLMTFAQGARCPGFNAQRKPLFLTLSCVILFLGAEHSEPPCQRSDKRWVVAITIRQHLGQSYAACPSMSMYWNGPDRASAVMLCQLASWCNG